MGASSRDVLPYDHLIGAERADHGLLPGAAGGADDKGAAAARELVGKQSDATGGAGDEYPFTQQEPALFQGTVCGQPSGRQGGGDGERNSIGDLRQPVGGHGHLLGPGA